MPYVIHSGFNGALRSYLCNRFNVWEPQLSKAARFATEEDARECLLAACRGKTTGMYRHAIIAEDR